MADYDFSCLPALTAIDKHWYQIETARKVLRQLGGRSPADEVGLGKTIEAGLILSEYLAGMIQSILVLPQPPLSQWQQELAEKFNINTVTTDDKQLQQNPEEFWTSHRTEPQHRQISQTLSPRHPKELGHRR